MILSLQYVSHPWSSEKKSLRRIDTTDYVLRKNGIKYSQHDGIDIPCTPAVVHSVPLTPPCIIGENSPLSSA